jgi:uncharacterized protein YdhG (YjbR/CyaY superfamily)
VMAGPRTVDEYLAGVPEDARATLEDLRAKIRAAAPEATESISYQIPTFRHGGPLVAFAAFKNHCSFFPMSLKVMDDLHDDLQPYDTAKTKGTIRFPVDEPLPASLVRKVVQARIAENAARRAP